MLSKNPDLSIPRSQPDRRTGARCLRHKRCQSRRWNLFSKTIVAADIDNFAPNGPKLEYFVVSKEKRLDYFLIILSI